MNRRFIVLTLTILAVGAMIFLRLYHLRGFVTFLGDQGRDAVIMKRLITLEHIPLIGAPSSVGQMYLGPFYYYLMAPFLLFFNFDPIGLAYGVAFLSIVGTCYAYTFVKKYIDDLSALFFLLLSTFSFTLVTYSRFSWNPNLVPVFSFLTFSWLYLWLKYDSVRYSILFGIFLSATTQLHFLALFMVFPSVIAIIWSRKDKSNRALFYKQMIVAICAFVALYIPWIAFDLRHNFINTRNFISFFTEGRVAGLSLYQVYLPQLAETCAALLRHLINVQLNSYAPLGIVLALLAVISHIAWRKRNGVTLLHCVNVLCFIMGFAALSTPRHPHYFGTVYLSIFYLIAYLLSQIHIRTLKYVLFLLISSTFIWFNARGYYFIFDRPSNQLTYAREVADSFKPFIKKQPVQIVPYPTTETDGHFRYFLDLDGYKVLANDTPSQAEELYVLCFAEKCQPLDDPQWQVAAFSRKRLATSWKIKNITIYKIVHGSVQ